MKFISINRSVLFGILLSGITATTSTSSSSNLDQEKAKLRSLADDAECIPLLKLTQYPNDVETSDIECLMSDTMEILPIEGLPDGLKEKFESGEYQSGETVLKVPGAERDAKVFKIPTNTRSESVSVIKMEKREQSGRRLQTGNMKTLALWARAPDSQTSTPMDNGNPGDLTDEIFGTYADNVNLRSQYAACSGNTLFFDPVNERSATGVQVQNGVHDVTISQSVNGVSDSTVRSAILDAAESDLGNLPNQYDHVMICMPPGTGSWLAYAYVNSWLSVYNDNWCTSVSAQVHEVGHNLNLAHSGEGSNEYADQSGLMGFSYGSDEGPEMCFNAPKNFQLGWYSNREVVLSSPNYSWSGRLYGIADYLTTSISRKMLIRMDDSSGSFSDIYISFNSRNGINSGTQEGGDQVLIHRKEGDVGVYGKSWLLAKMSSGATYQASMSGSGNIPITVISINTSSNPPYAEIQIGSGNPSPTPPPTQSPTKSPSSSPTRSPVASPIANPPTTPSPTRSPVASPPTGGDDCNGLSKRFCRRNPVCKWKNNRCVTIDNPPVSPPVSPPSGGGCASLDRRACKNDDECRWNRNRQECVDK